MAKTFKRGGSKRRRGRVGGVFGINMGTMKQNLV